MRLFLDCMPFADRLLYGVGGGRYPHRGEVGRIEARPTDYNMGAGFDYLRFSFLASVIQRYFITATLPTIAREEICTVAAKKSRSPLPTPPRKYTTPRDTASCPFPLNCKVRKCFYKAF